MAAPFRIYNSLSRSIEDFTPQKEGHVGLYVCGMTVYDHIHVGHARAMVVFDAFVRYLRHREWDVTFVRNFTDVDDKIIVRSAETGEEPLALAQRYIDAFHEDVDNLDGPSRTVWIAKKSEMKNLKSGSFTRLEIEDFTADPNLRDRDFSQRQLTSSR